MRVGVVVKLIYDRKFGFIQSDHFRDDVFFHFSKVVGSRPDLWYAGQEVEFDLNEVRRLELNVLEAEKVQIASRPLSHMLNERDKPGMSPTHHPKARRRKPSWRKPDSVTGSSSQSDSVASDNETPKDSNQSLPTDSSNSGHDAQNSDSLAENSKPAKDT